MLMDRIWHDEEWQFVTLDGEGKLGNVHRITDDCLNHGCAVHNPTPGPLSHRPYNWRTDRNIMERICEHGIGHPDHDSAAFQRRFDRAYENVHGCDGCCGNTTESGN